MLSRRTCLNLFSRTPLAAALGSVPISLLVNQVPSFGQSLPPQDNNYTVEEWMDKWMIPARESDRPLYLGRFVEPMYFLKEPIGWRPNPEQRYNPVDVPEGFVTDLASIPRPFWSFLRPDGNYVYGAIVHDYLYWTQTRPRAEADEILKFSMQDFSVNRLVVDLVYNAVRIGGGAAWEMNRKLKTKGERRFLKEPPSRPTVFWSDWKKQGDHFRPE